MEFSESGNLLAALEACGDITVIDCVSFAVKVRFTQDELYKLSPSGNSVSLFCRLFLEGSRNVLKDCSALSCFLAFTLLTSLPDASAPLFLLMLSEPHGQVDPDEDG